MNSKIDFARTLTPVGQYGSNHSDCFYFGITYGCQADCPQYCRGECEHQEENRKKFEEEEDGK